MGQTLCSYCSKPVSEGEHRMSSGQARSYPRMSCPKCSGDGWPTCVANKTGHYKCSCGVTWTEPLASL
jgi:hypothetical protein